MDNIFKTRDSGFFLENITVERLLKDAETAFDDVPHILFLLTPIVLAVPEPAVLAAHKIDVKKFFTEDLDLRLSRETALKILTIIGVHAECELSFFKTGKIRFDLCEKYKVSAKVEEKLCATYAEQIRKLYTSLINYLKGVN